MYENIKLAFFDFDRTLFSHEYPTAGDNYPSYEEECYIQLTRQAEYQESDKPVPAMQWLVSELKKRDVILYVLTHEIFNLRNDYKKNLADRFYGIRHYLTVNSGANKIPMIRAVSRFHQVSVTDCLFVDDKMNLIYDACAEGIVGVHTSNICRIYEESLLRR